MADPNPEMVALVEQYGRATVIEILVDSGVVPDEHEAEFIVALELGETSGDVLGIEDIADDDEDDPDPTQPA